MNSDQLIPKQLSKDGIRMTTFQETEVDPNSLNFKLKESLECARKYHIRRFTKLKECRSADSKQFSTDEIRIITFQKAELDPNSLNSRQNESFKVTVASVRKQISHPKIYQNSQKKVEIAR